MRKVVGIGLLLIWAVFAQSQVTESAATTPLPTTGSATIPVMVFDSWAEMGSDNMQIEAEHPVAKPGFELWIIAAMLLLYGLFSLYYKGYLSENIRVVVNYRLATQVERERELANSLPSLVLMVLFFLSAGMLLWRIVPAGDMLPLFGHPLLDLLAFLAILPLLYLVKRLTHFVFSEVFLFREPTERFVFLSNVLIQTAGYALFPFLFLFYLSDETRDYIFIPIAGGLLVLLLIIRAVSLLRIAASIPQFRVSYFLLYFCAFEIAPIVIILSILEGQANFK